ncbi:MAG: HAD-IA family hydrolase, partial [Bacteroidales bacterium]|nr:HAD-IA family hydrolase [Bacteroidales bacterium]
EVCAFWYEKHPWQGLSFIEVEDLVVARVIELIGQNDTKMPGVIEILNYFKTKNLKIGLASNSSHNLIEVVLEKIGIKEYFDYLSSAQDVIKGKPNPAVYLAVAKNLGVEPHECLVFEDSIIGITAAKNAGMTVVAVPDEADFHSEVYQLADYKIKMLTDFIPFFWSSAE